MMEVIRLPDVATRLKELQVDPSGNTSAEFARLIETELARWAEIAKAANIKLD
jgi:tripartite-type tricarboxylate transporter receptor subunit TctC